MYLILGIKKELLLSEIIIILQDSNSIMVILITLNLKFIRRQTPY